jgi:hypothetical protein
MRLILICSRDVFPLSHGARNAIIYCEGLRKIADAAAFPERRRRKQGRWELLLALKFASSGSDAGQVAKRDNLLAFFVLIVLPCYESVSRLL